MGAVGREKKCLAASFLKSFAKPFVVALLMINEVCRTVCPIISQTNVIFFVGRYAYLHTFSLVFVGCLNRKSDGARFGIFTHIFYILNYLSTIYSTYTCSIYRHAQVRVQCAFKKGLI